MMAMAPNAENGVQPAFAATFIAMQPTRLATLNASREQIAFSGPA
jgi:hypothetical protein